MVQIIRCKCGSVFAACHEPECYTDDDWIADLKAYVLQGSTVGLVKGTDFKFENCICSKLEEQSEQSDINQLKIEF